VLAVVAIEEIRDGLRLQFIEQDLLHRDQRDVNSLCAERCRKLDSQKTPSNYHSKSGAFRATLDVESISQSS
jgi:hypothetical protein